ncbi:MAG: NADH dehydrogenase (quinone) subunit D [Chloroflexi bacterium]|nr:NADH dehydrogenase (quinone) subunit D [Chloroflexota bacterium]
MAIDTRFRAEDEAMILNMGPQHPATHGVLRLVLTLEGEILKEVSPVIGYLHSGFEKTFEQKKYLQGVPLTDRMDYLNPMGNNLAYSLAVEKLLGVEAPPRAQVARVLLAELTRIQSHLVAIGSTALDLNASSVMMYAFREREILLDIFELCSGQRMMTSYIRPGGLARDLPPEFPERVQAFLDILPNRLAEYHGLLTRNPIWLDRQVGVGKLTAEQCLQLGVTGPMLRSAGVPRDLRKDDPYCGYDGYDFEVITRQEADCYARYLIRMDEMLESLKIVKQALARLPEGPYVLEDYKVAFPPRQAISDQMEGLIHHFKLATEGFKVPAGEVYVATESPRGELGFYIVSDGSSKPYRVHVRTPSFANLQSLREMGRGAMLSDLIPMIAAIDPIMGDVDR